MDGTLLDWQTGMEASWLAACEEGCVCSPELDAEVLYAAIVKRSAWFWEDPERARIGRMNLYGSSRSIVHHALTDLGMQRQELAHKIADDYRTRRDAAIAPYPGAIETLQAISERAIALALITNGNAQAQRTNIERFQLDRYFQCIIVEGEFGLGKPDERVFRHALAATGCDPEQTWMVGDSLEADIETPHRLGMHTVWVDGAGRGLSDSAPVRPHRIVRTITELV